MRGPRVLDLRTPPPDPVLLRMVATHLAEGGLAALPTETVYGFSCALREEALRELRRLKGRESHRPFLLLAPDEESVRDLAWTSQARELARTFWPGALTLVLRDPGGRFPSGVRSPRGSVAVRISPHPLVKGILEILGEPIVSTSANAPGAEPALTAGDAREWAVQLGAGDTFWVVDGGDLAPSPPSTLVDCTGEEPVVIREGTIPVGRLRCLFPGIREGGVRP